MRMMVTILILCIVVVGLAIQLEQFPGPGKLVRDLASRPDVARTFQDKFDAAMFLFTAVLLTPIALVGTLLALALATILIDGTVMQMGRCLGLPDRIMMAFVGLTLVGVAWIEADLWLPGSLQLLGMLARAYLVSVT
jgi:hypothetical protein